MKKFHLEWPPGSTMTHLYIYKIVANFDLIPRTTARAFDLQGWNFNMYCAILWRWYIIFFKVIDQLVWAQISINCSDKSLFWRLNLNFWGHPTFPVHLRTIMVRVNFQNFILKWISITSEVRSSVAHFVAHFRKTFCKWKAMHRWAWGNQGWGWT